MNQSLASTPLGNDMSDEIPLVVDLDGTLILGDLLHESALKLTRLQPLTALQIPLWLLRGKATMKDEIAQRVGVGERLGEPAPRLDTPRIPLQRP